MATGQTIETKITVDAKQATAEVDKFAGKLSAVEEKAKTSGLSLVSLQDQAKNLQTKLGPAAAAISGVAGALGETNGEAGKALAAIGQVTAAFGAGGPFGAALAAGTFAVDALTQSWERSIKAQDAALAAQYAQFDATNKTTKELEKQAEALRLQFAPLSPSEIRSRAQAQMSELDRTIRVNEGMAIRDKQKAADYRAQNLQLEKQKALIFEIADLQAKSLQKSFAKPLAAKATQPSGISSAEIQADVEEKAINWLAKMREEALALAKKQRDEEAKIRGQEIADAFAARDMEIKAAKQAQEERTRIAREQAEERNKIAETERQVQVDAITSAASEAAAAIGVFAAEAASGQEAAFANLLSAAAQQAGGMVVLEGGKLLAGGIAGALVGNPAAPGQIAGGLGLVAAGTAIQTGGPAAVQSLLGMAGGAAPSGGGATSAARDRGASPRSPRSGGEGGPLVVNVAYGVAGPLPEDTAREIAKAVKTGNRRRGAA